MSDTGYDIQIDVAQKIKEPSLYKVIFLNDDKTPFDFVIMVLISFFQMDEPQAIEFSGIVHNEGKGVAGTFAFEIAKQKQAETTSAARQQGYPLRVLLEEV